MWVHGVEQRSVALEIHNPQRHFELFKNQAPFPSIIPTLETKSPNGRQIQMPSRLARGIGWKHGHGLPILEESWLMGTSVLSRLRMGSFVETSAPFGKVLAHARQWPAEYQRETSTAEGDGCLLIHTARQKSCMFQEENHGARRP